MRSKIHLKLTAKIPPPQKKIASMPMLAIETLVPLNCSAVVFVSNLIADYVNPLETHTIVGRSPVYQRCAEQEDL